MNCPEHLVFKGFGSRVYLWMYWRDVPRETIPLRIWLNPLRYELSIRVSTTRSRVIVFNREGRMARIFANRIFYMRERWNRRTPDGGA